MPVPLAILLLSLSMLVPALVNGGAFLFPDTTAYVRGADAAVVRLAHHRSIWSDRLLQRYPDTTQSPSAPAAVAAISAPQAPASRPLIFSGRSIYYGALLYLSLLGNSFWPIVILQAAVASCAILLTVHRFASGEEGGIAPWRMALVLLLPIVTSVGYFSAFAMPDIFAALAIVAAGHIALAWKIERRSDRAFWFLLAAAAMLFHTATLLILLALTLIFTIVRRISPSIGQNGRVWPLLLAILIALVGEALFSASIRITTGTPPVRPPFLTARLIEDGPGTRYLKTHCEDDTTPFLICRYRDRLPLPSDAFLWSDDKRNGLVKVLSPTMQRALADDDRRFVTAVFMADPFGVIGSVLHNSVSQGLANGLDEFNPYPGAIAQMSDAIPNPIRHDLAQTAAFQERMPIAAVSALAMPLAILSLVLAGYDILGRNQPTDRRKPTIQQSFVIWIISGVLLNAIICGAMSGPHDRYGARVIWLLPMIALILLQPRRASALSTGKIADPSSS